jgi:hypothetical protein
VEFTHHRDPRLVVEYERLTIDGQSVATGRDSCCSATQLEYASLRGESEGASIDAYEAGGSIR